jgi:DNA-binding XRE family transcriptional regulator
MKQPAPSDVKRLRELAGHSREQAAELVHAVYRTWQNWELDPSSPEAREIPLAVWELYLVKLTRLGADHPAAIAADKILRGR